MRKRYERRWRHVWWETNLDAINRPHVFYWNIEGPDSCVVGARQRTGGIGLSWGNGASDPVWLVEVHLPAWLLRWLPESWG